MIVQCGPGAAVVLHDDAAPRLRGAIRDIVIDSDPLGAFLSAVSSIGLRHAPDFVFAMAEDGSLRVLQRGSIPVGVLVGGAVRDLGPALGVSTWTEHVVDGATDLVVRANGVEHRIVLAASAHAPLPRAVSEPAVTAELAATAVPDETLMGLEEPDVTGDVGPDAGAASASDSEPIDLGNLFETRYRGVEAAAVRNEEPDIPQTVARLVGPSPTAVPPSSAEPAPAHAEEPQRPEERGLIVGVPGASAVAAVAPPAPRAATLGEHDGLTVSGESLAAMRASLADKAAGAGANSAGGAGNAAPVAAVLCPAGHANPPAAPNCRTCRVAITDRAIRHVPRPVVGRLVFDSGMVVDVDRRLLIGRKPAADPNGPVGDLPSLVPLPDPELVLSRNHAEIRVEGWDLTLIDHGSRNGTFVLVPGQATSIRLRANEPHPLSDGTRIDFADVAGCRYEIGAR